MNKIICKQTLQFSDFQYCFARRGGEYYSNAFSMDIVFLARNAISSLLIFTAVLVFAGASVAANSLPERGTHTLTLEHQTGSRTYVAFVPWQTQVRRAPLVIALHGYGGSGENILSQGRWRESAARHGFIVLAPDGTVEKPDRAPRLAAGNPRSWNAGPASAGSAAARNVDDSGFLRALIDVWVSAGRVDPDRIYITGFSNGAAMSFKAGADLSEIVSAIAPVSNGILARIDQLDKPVPLLMIWGEADPINPIEGGDVKRGKAEHERPSAEKSFQQWSSLLECRGQPSVTTPQRDVKLLQHSICKSGSEARFYRISGLGHQWPGGRNAFVSISGPGSDAVDATELIWSFFASHPRPLPKSRR